MKEQRKAITIPQEVGEHDCDAVIPWEMLGRHNNLPANTVIKSAKLGWRQLEPGKPYIWLDLTRDGAECGAEGTFQKVVPASCWPTQELINPASLQRLFVESSESAAAGLYYLVSQCIIRAGIIVTVGKGKDKNHLRITLNIPGRYKKSTQAQIVE